VTAVPTLNDMPVSVVLVERKRDGKLYPQGGYLPWEQRAVMIGTAHMLHCKRGLSYRKTVAALAERGYRRSLGQVYADIRDYSCRACDPWAFPGAPPRPG
jgi:hypothetical protein